jgi:hypothetical protein
MASAPCVRSGNSFALHVLQLWRIRQNLRVTPPMQAGAANHLWTLEEIIGLLDSKEGSTK